MDFETKISGTSGDDTFPKTNNPDDALPKENFSIDLLELQDTVTLSKASTNFEILGKSGRDSVTAQSDVSDAKIAGGSGDDTIEFDDTVKTASIYGGQGNDSLDFGSTSTATFIAGDDGDDKFDLERLVSTTVKGGDGDDSIDFLATAKSESSEIYGGADNDTINVNAKHTDLLVKLGADEDFLRVTAAKHTNSQFKGNGGDDTITIAAITGNGNAVYAGQGEDDITVASNAEMIVSGDKGDDTIDITATGSDGATVKGGSGDDDIDNAGIAGSKISIKGGAGDDNIEVSLGKDTIYAGKGDDIITAQVAASTESSLLSGDLGDDAITLNSEGASKVMGGDGDDTITSTVEALVGDDKAHTISGGAGTDVINVESNDIGDFADDYKVAKNTTKLTYASAAELITNNAIVDEITIEDGNVAIAEVSEALTVTTATDFSNISMSAGANGERTEAEGLIIKTGSSVSAGSTVKISAEAADVLLGFDTSAATGNSSLDASLAQNSMLLIGGNGFNTITGGDGADVIKGGSTKDTLNGGEGADRITTGKGDDVINGGEGNDTIVMGANFDQGKTITAGDDTDTLNFTYTEKAVAAIDKIAAALKKTNDNKAVGAADVYADFEVIEFDDEANVSTTFTLPDEIADTSFAVRMEAGSTKVLKFSGAEEKSAALTITGGNAADVVVGGTEADTITGAGGDDAITMAAADVLGFGISASATVTALGNVTGTIAEVDARLGSDTITGYTVAANSIELSQDAFGEVAAGALGALAGAKFAAGATGVAVGVDFTTGGFAYNETTGELSYVATDVTGVNFGALDSSNSALIATFAGAPALTVGEFTVVA